MKRSVSEDEFREDVGMADGRERRTSRVVNSTERNLPLLFRVKNKTIE